MASRHNNPKPIDLDELKALTGGGWQKPTAPTIASQVDMPGLPPRIRQLSPQMGQPSNLANAAESAHPGGAQKLPKPS
jgi:hypothetical protein